MIPRYSRKEMAAVWEPENRLAKWLKIELLACEAMVQLGQVPAEALKRIKEKASFTVDRVEEIEKTVKHDVIAFLTAVSEQVGPEARFLHLGMTSSDILDTAFALQLVEAATILEKDLQALLKVLRRRAEETKHLPMVGRTHGMHAEPITMGLVFALWFAEMERNRIRLLQAQKNIAYGKISGAVGTFAHLSPEVEAYVCKQCGLTPDPISNQIIQRDRHAEFFTTLALIATSIEKIALQIRHLQRTEVAEAEEPFTRGQKGSSAMPHKRNPVSAENLTGLARVVRAHALAAMENVALWHERDISHSSVERIIAPDSTILLDYMLSRLTSMLEGLVIYPEAMKANLEKSQGLIFSEGLLLELIEKGLTREEAYDLVQQAAFRALEEKKHFQEVVLRDEAMRKYFKADEIRKIFDLKHSLRHVDTIFQRVFGPPPGPPEKRGG